MACGIFSSVLLMLIAAMLSVEAQSQRSNWGPRWTRNPGPGAGQNPPPDVSPDIGIHYGGAVRHVTYTKNCAVWRIPKSKPPRRSRRRHGHSRPASRRSNRWRGGSRGPPPPPSRKSSPVDPEQRRPYYPRPRGDTCEGTKLKGIPGEIYIIKEYEVGDTKLCFQRKWSCPEVQLSECMSGRTKIARFGSALCYVCDRECLYYNRRITPNTLFDSMLLTKECSCSEFGVLECPEEKQEFDVGNLRGEIDTFCNN